MGRRVLAGGFGAGRPSGCLRWWCGIAHGGTGGSRKRSLAHPVRVGETFDWMAREGVVVAQLRMGAVRKGAGGHAAGPGRD